jgi:hypothetical protein
VYRTFAPPRTDPATLNAEAAFQKCWGALQRFSASHQTALTDVLQASKMGELNDTGVVQRLAARLGRDPGFPVDKPTESFWQVPRHSFADRQSETLPNEADVVIIGSGITGISIARHIASLRPSVKIAMLEARSAISGATGRNGGHIKAVPWADYSILKEVIGKESAMRVTKFRLAHLDALVAEAEELGEAGRVGLVRRVQGVSAVFDSEAWQAAKVKLEAWLEDFPEERERWKVHEGAAELKVVFSTVSRWRLFADVCLEIGNRQRLRLH